jgi:hypothetical protein
MAPGTSRSCGDTGQSFEQGPAEEVQIGAFTFGGDRDVRTLEIDQKGEFSGLSRRESVTEVTPKKAIFRLTALSDQLELRCDRRTVHAESDSGLLHRLCPGLQDEWQFSFILFHFGDKGRGGRRGRTRR